MPNSAYNSPLPVVLTALLLFAALAIAYANGANANFKGVASLLGSGTLGYGPCIAWASLTTAAGCIVALLGSTVMLQAFSGKGLVPEDLAAQPTFLFAVAGGAGLANLLATRLGFPVSTTHMLLGGLMGTGLAASPDRLQLATLWDTFAQPLLLAPPLAILVAASLHLLLRRLQLAPDHRTPWLDRLHGLSAGAVCFARGMNDTPKMAALLIGIVSLSTRTAMLLIAAAMAIGGLISARQVAHTLAHKITDLNPGQGFSANLTTAVLVILGSLKGLPLSTTHVTVGALLGIGISTQQARWQTVLPVLAAWVITLPAAAVLSASLWKLGCLFI